MCSIENFCLGFKDNVFKYLLIIFVILLDYYQKKYFEIIKR